MVKPTINQSAVMSKGMILSYNSYTKMAEVNIYDHGSGKIAIHSDVPVYMDEGLLSGFITKGLRARDRVEILYIGGDKSCPVICSKYKETEQEEEITSEGGSSTVDSTGFWESAKDLISFAIRRLE